MIENVIGEVVKVSSVFNYEVKDEWLSENKASVEDVQEEMKKKFEEALGKIADKLAKSGYKVKVHVEAVDTVQTFNAPCYPREYRYFETVYKLMVIEDYSNLKRYVIYALVKEGYYCSTAWFSSVDDVWFETEPLVTKETAPFTYALINNIPWAYIRPVWKPQIVRIVNEIGEAEIKGKLKEKLEEVEEIVKANMWIYDFQHLHRAIGETKKQML